MRHEPIFTRQEQGVVYLFSRYWDKIPVFKNKRISRIHIRFPDFSIEDTKTVAEEGIEFEYGLSDFWSHIGHLKNLNTPEPKIRRLYIVYWEHNADEKELLKSIRGRRGKNDFTGKVIFVCLKDYFRAGVEAGVDCLNTFWIFTTKRLPKTYPFNKIEEDTKQLATQGVIELVTPCKDLYSTTGFNKIGAAFIECGHWQRIHFYTTTKIALNNIPCRLLVKPTGCKYFSGYFEIQYAFRINRGSKLLREYYRNYYFYPSHRYYQENDRTCLVYSHFKTLDYDEGGKLYRYLKGKNYAIGVPGIKQIRNPAHISRINSIVG